MLLSASMLASLGFAEWLRPRQLLSDVRPAIDWERVVPKQFGNWRLDSSLPVVVANLELQQTLDTIYSQMVSRTYVSTAGKKIMLCIAYGVDQSDTTRVHLPEVCYPAQGFEVKTAGTSSINLADGEQLPVKHLVARLATRVEPITYWLVVGNEIVLSNSTHKLAQLRYGFSGWIPDGLIVRLSSLDTDARRAYIDHAAFARSLQQALDRTVSARIFGATLPET